MPDRIIRAEARTRIVRTPQGRTRVVRSSAATRIVTSGRGLRGPTGLQPGGIMTSFPGRLAPGELLWRLENRPLLDWDAEGSKASVGTPFAVDQELVATLDGDPAVTMSFAAGEIDAEITFHLDPLPVGLFVLYAPSPQDATGADLSITLGGTRRLT